MISVIGYDLVDSFDKTKPYISKANKKLYLVGIPYYRYYIWLKRFDKDINRYKYFVLLTSTLDETLKLLKCNYNNSKEIRIDVPDEILKELSYDKQNPFNVSLEIIEDKEDYVVYSVDK